MGASYWRSQVIPQTKYRHNCQFSMGRKRVLPDFYQTAIATPQGLAPDPSGYREHLGRRDQPDKPNEPVSSGLDMGMDQATQPTREH